MPQRRRSGVRKSSEDERLSSQRTPSKPAAFIFVAASHATISPKPALHRALPFRIEPLHTLGQHRQQLSQRAHLSSSNGIQPSIVGLPNTASEQQRDTVDLFPIASRDHNRVMNGCVVRRLSMQSSSISAIITHVSCTSPRDAESTDQPTGQLIRLSTSDGSIIDRMSAKLEHEEER